MAMIIGCNDSGTESPVIHPGIKGYVVLYSDGITPLGDSSGVTVSADGPVRDSVVTSRGGHWTLTPLPPGTYSLTFSKQGFGLKKIANVHLPSDKQIDLGRVIMVHKPWFNLTSLSIAPEDSEMLISGDFSYSGGSYFGATVAFFMDTTDLVFQDLSHYISYATTFVPPPSTSYELHLTRADIKTLLGLSSGTQVYVTAVTASALFVFSGYQDSTSGNWVFTAVGDSLKGSSFTIP